MQPERKWYRFLLFLPFVAFAVIVGCSKPQISNLANDKAFANAAPELQADWRRGSECFRQRDYVRSVSNYALLFGHLPELSTEQSNSLLNVWMELGNKVYQAADKGDREALQAVFMIRDSGFAKPDGRR